MTLQRLQCGPEIFHGCACGVFFSIQVPQALRLDWQAQLPHGTVPAAELPAETVAFRIVAEKDGGPLRTFAGAEGTGSFHLPAEALAQLGRDLMIHVADRAPDRIFLHAGVVALGSHGLMLPGTSFAGKTTLVAALVRAGATYYSDEYAVIDCDGRVHPWARELQMRTPGRPEQHGVPVASLAGHAGTEPLQIVQVVFARYVPGAVWQPRSVSAGLAALAMMTHAIAVQRSPARVMSALERVLAGATAWCSDRDEAGTVAALLLAALKCA